MDKCTNLRKIDCEGCDGSRKLQQVLHVARNRHDQNQYLGRVENPAARKSNILKKPHIF